MPDLPPPFASGRTAEIFAWGEGTVLKLYRGEFPSSWVDYEYKIAREVCAVGANAPAVYDLLEVNGRRGIVYQRIQGVSMIDAMARSPLKLVAFARLMADLHLDLHSHATSALPSYRDRTAGAIWETAELSQEWKEKALRRLVALPDGSQLCHGDFHPGNILLTAQGASIIDWNNAAHGSSWADVARTLLMMRTGYIPPETPARLFILIGRSLFVSAYLRRYLSRCPDPERQVQAWLPVLAAARLAENIPEEVQALKKIVKESDW